MLPYIPEKSKSAKKQNNYTKEKESKETERWQPKEHI